MSRLVLFSVLVASAILSSPSRSDEFSNRIGDYSGKGLTISVPSTPAFTDLANLAQSHWEDNGVRIEFKYEEQGYISTKQIGEISGNIGLDIVTTNSTIIDSYIRQGLVRSLEQIGPDVIEQYFSVAMNMAAIRSDEIYGLPIFGSTTLMYYNKCRLEEAGYSEPPKEWSQLLEGFVPEYDALTDSSPYRNGLAMQWQGVMPLLNLLRISGSNFYEYSGGEFDIDPDFIKGLEMMPGLSRYLPPGSVDNEQNSQQIIGAVHNGDVALAIIPSHAANAIDSMEWNVRDISNDDCLGVTTEPSGLSGAVYPSLGTHVLSIAKTADDPELAELFIQWAASEEIARELITLGHLPLRPSAYRSITEDGALHDLKVSTAMAFAETWSAVSPQCDRRNNLTPQIQWILSEILVDVANGHTLVGESREEIVSLLDRSVIDFPDYLGAASECGFGGYSSSAQYTIKEAEESANFPVVAHIMIPPTHEIRQSDAGAFNESLINGDGLPAEIKEALEIRYGLDISAYQSLSDVDRSLLEQEAAYRLFLSMLPEMYDGLGLKQSDSAAGIDFASIATDEETNLELLKTVLPPGIHWPEIREWIDPRVPTGEFETRPDTPGGEGSPEYSNPDQPAGSESPEVQTGQAIYSRAVTARAVQDAGGNVSHSRLIYPEPEMEEGICSSPVDPVPKSSSTVFVYKVDPDGRRPLRSCMEGFLDTALIKDSEVGREEPQICSGVWLHKNWLITVRHCADYFLHNYGEGAVFIVSAEDLDCLDRRSKNSFLDEQPDQRMLHPGDRCNVDEASVIAAHSIREWAVQINERDLIPLQFVLLEVENGPERPQFPILFRGAQASPDPIEIATAGFGATSGEDPNMGGALNVGRALIKSLGYSERGDMLFSLSDGFPGALISHACAGDSGSPVYVGRPHGYSNEAHALVGLITSSDFSAGAEEEDECSSIPALDIYRTRILSLSVEGIDRWVCETTDNVLDWCNALMAYAR